MADADDLKSLLARWAVPFTEEAADRDGERSITVGPSDFSDRVPTVDGYSGFLTQFVFKADGTFVRMGAWE